MAANIDALYAELYPDSPPNKAAGTVLPKASSFDDDAPPATHSGGGGAQPTLLSRPAGGAPQQQAPKRPSGGNGFDSEEEEASGADGARITTSSAQVISSVSTSTLNTVPFPNVSHPIYDQIVANYRCTQAFRCYVCSPSSKLSAPLANEAERLRELFVANNTPQAAAQLAKDPRLHQDLLRRKGAYHVCAPQRGNGCCDYTHQSSCGGQTDPAATAGALGGCPFLICRKCDHPVIRADGVRWYGSKVSTASSAAKKGLDEAAEPETDLYLVVRNYYPDWSRIATAPIVGNGGLTSTSQNIVAPAGGATPTAAATPPPPKSSIDAFDDDDDEEEVHVVASSFSMASVAASSPSGSPIGGGSDVYALVSDPNASAYCCQCSWLSVMDTPVGAAVGTTVADTAMYAHTPKDPSVLTKFIAVIADGETVDYARYAGDKRKRRLPLWACKGHMA